MNAEQLVLERFDGVRPRSGAGPNPNESAGWRLENLLIADATASDGDVTESAETDPLPDPPPEPAQEEPTELADPAAPDPLVAIAKAISMLAADGERLRCEIRNEFACVFARAAESVLPTLADTGFAGELTRATIALCERSPHQALTLAIAPEIIAEMRQRLEASDVDLTIELVADAAIAPGRAELRWQGGGANFDSGRLVETAITLMKSRIPELAGVERGNDE